MAIEKEDRIPAHPVVAKGFLTREPPRVILMTPLMATLGGLLVFFAAAVVTVVFLPTFTYNPPASPNWVPLPDAALNGRAHYLANGCVYCHSGYTRPQDVFWGQYYTYPRVSVPGDFWEGAKSPNLFGTARTGPDLSQDGGQHPDDWHRAHYWSPRAPNPPSIMPRFTFLSDTEVAEMTAYNQNSGGKEGLLRYAAQTVGKELMKINMGMAQPEELFPDLVQQLQQQGIYQTSGQPSDTSPSGLPWMAVWMMNSFERGYWLTPDPLPATPENLLVGKKIFLDRCVGCHGAKGDGNGPAAQFLTPPPFDFTATGMTGVTGPFSSDGQFYHRILTAGKGTAMENFGTRLSVEDIWRVVLFLRTIQNGSLETGETVPNRSMWEPWTPPTPMLSYIDQHPIRSGPGVIDQTMEDPFMAAAHWTSPGMAADDEILIGGKLPMTLERLKGLIRSTFDQMVEQAYNQAQARGEALPSKDEIMSVEGIQFHAP